MSDQLYPLRLYSLSYLILLALRSHILQNLLLSCLNISIVHADTRASVECGTCPFANLGVGGSISQENTSCFDTCAYILQVDSIQFGGGGTNATTALVMLNSLMSANITISNPNKIVYFIAHNPQVQDNVNGVIMQANRAKNVNKISIYSIGVANTTNLKTMQTVATPGLVYYINPCQDYTLLNQMADTLIEASCPTCKSTQKFVTSRVTHGENYLKLGV